MLIKTVAIIGAGPSGIVAAKEAKCSGLSPTVFEKGDTIGGQWKPNEGGVWESMRINNSRYASAFSDYEWEDCSEDFPNQKDVYKYLCAYADNFHIHQEVQLRSIVTKVEESEGKWYVEWIDKEGTVKSFIFDFVIVCSGVFSTPFIPEIPGLNTFSGSVIHARDYKTPDLVEGQSVAVVGNAFSGCEIAVEVADKAKEVFHIFNSPKWIVSRYIKDGNFKRVLPFDLALYNRESLASFKRVYRYKRNKKAYEKCRSLCRGQKGLPKEWSIKKFSKGPPFVTISDSYISQLKKKKILPIKESIQRIDGDTLYLSNNESIKVNNLIFCTGYRTAFPFFGASILERLNFRKEESLQSLFLYKTVFHPEFLGMAFVGMARFSIFFGPIELQARLACMTFSEKIPLRDKAIMEEEIEFERDLYYKNPKSQFIQGYVGFCDDLAKHIGVLPDFSKLKKTDSILYKKLWNGSFTTASFRLVGFGSDRESALKKIDKVISRVGRPFLHPKCTYH